MIRITEEKQKKKNRTMYKVDEVNIIVGHLICFALVLALFYDIYIRCTTLVYILFLFNDGNDVFT